MNSLVVLFALVAAAAAAPHVPVVAYQQPAPVAYVVPSAVSSQSRVDVHSTPALYATEIVGTPAFYAGNNFYGAQVAPGYFAPGLVPQQYFAPGFVPQAYAAPGTVVAFK